MIINEVYLFWMCVNLESDVVNKVEIFDEILKCKFEDVEVIVYKVDVLLEINEMGEVIELCN